MMTIFLCKEIVAFTDLMEKKGWEQDWEFDWTGKQMVSVLELQGVGVH